MTTDVTGPDAAVLAVSHRYGGDSAFVLAGGGNTSTKTADTLWVKASGHALATIGADGFVALDRGALAAMLAADWPGDAKARESLFLERVLAARREPDRGQRPSVEALLHHLLPDTLVVHTHPGLVNAVTCCVDGERLTTAWFGDDVLWQPYVDPGLTLAKALQARLTKHHARAGRPPAAIFLENHGLIVAGDTAEAVAATSSRMLDRIRDALRTTSTIGFLDGESIHPAVATLKRLLPNLYVAASTGQAAQWAASTPGGRVAATGGPLSPDQIVYCRSQALWLEQADDATITQGWQEYTRRFGVEPWVVVVRDVGVIALRDTEKMAAITLAVFLDAAAVSRDAERLGGVRPLSAEHRQFIEQWEVEAYRQSIAARG